MRVELQPALRAAKDLPAEDLPRLLGELEEIRCTALARLSSRVPVLQQPDKLLGVAEAAERLGMSQDYLYRNSRSLPFTRRVAGRVKFSSQGIEKYIRTAQSS
jgi:hypothetical protein